jgi:hypothetical protein
MLLQKVKKVSTTQGGQFLTASEKGAKCLKFNIKRYKIPQCDFKKVTVSTTHKVKSS